MSKGRGLNTLISVVHVVPYYPPDRIGGVGEHVKVIHEGHVDMALNSMIVTSGVTESDFRVHRVGRTPVAFFLRSWQLRRKTKACDVLHVHHGEGLLITLLTRLRRHRPKVLAMFHVDVRMRERASGPHVFEGRRFGPTGLRRVIQRLTGSAKGFVDWIVWLLADAVVVETNAVKVEVSDLRPSRPVSVIPHGLGPAPEGETQHDPVELLYVGTPGVRKRTYLLPSILHSVTGSIPNVGLRIVGFSADGDPLLRAEAERLGVLDAIDFIGPVRAEEVVPYYRSADVLVLPSAYEGLPMVLLEAMREGLVPVATAVSGHPDAIDDDVNGYLVALDDVDELARRCVSLIRDREKLGEMGQQAKKTIAERFSLDSELMAYIDLYRKITRGVKRSDRSDSTGGTEGEITDASEVS